VALGAFRGPPR